MMYAIVLSWEKFSQITRDHIVRSYVLYLIIKNGPEKNHERSFARKFTNTEIYVSTYTYTVFLIAI